MELEKEVEDRIQSWIKRKYYYVRYPDSVDEYWWQDREGDWHRMHDMSLDHLKASANLIERDLKNSFSPKEMNYEAYNRFLISPAQKKLAELKEVLKEKVGV